MSNLISQETRFSMHSREMGTFISMKTLFLCGTCILTMPLTCFGQHLISKLSLSLFLTHN